MFERVWQDIRHGARSLWKMPGFAVISILTLALGVGTNTAMFSIVNGVLLQRLPYNEANRLLKFFASMTIPGWTAPQK